jgi:hypothetical protein
MIKSRRMRWGGHVARIGDKRNAYRKLVRRPRCRWVENIKMVLREIGWECMDWIDLAEDSDQWRRSCEHGNEPSGSIKCWEILE